MSEELRPCPFCDVNEWKYQSHFSGTTIYQCEKCGTIVEEWVINTRPIEDAAEARIAELEGFIGKLIEVSEKMFTAVIAAADPYDEGMREWDKIVNGWKEG